MSDFKVVSLLNPGGVNVGILTVSAGTTDRSQGSIVFSNANGLSFGMDAGTITASHNGLTSQSNQAFSAQGGSSAFQTLAFANANGFTFSNNGGSVQGSYTVPTVPAQLSVGNSNLGNTAGDTGVVTGRVVLVGSNNVTLSGSTNGGSMTISFAAGGGGGGAAISAAGASASDGTVVFSNSNGVSFGMNGSTVTATVKTDYLTTAMLSNAATISNIRVSAGTTSNLLSALTFADSNGISIGLNASTLTLSHNGLTSQSNQNVTAGNGGFAFQTLSFSNVNGISFGTSAGSAITASHNALTSQSNQAFSADASSTFQTLSFQDSNGISFSNNAGAIRLTHGLQFTSATSAITSNAMHSSQSRMTLYAVSNTTQSTSNTVPFSALSFHGAGIASVGVSNGSVIVSVPAGAPSPVNFSAGTTSGNLGSVVFSNGSNVSFGLNGSTITASVAGSFQSAGMSDIGDTGGTSGLVGSQLVLAGSHGIGLSQSVNGASATLTIYPELLSQYDPNPQNVAFATNSSVGQNTLYYYPFDVNMPVSGSRLNVFIRLSGATSTGTASTCGGVLALGYALYTRGTGTASERISRVTSYSMNVISHTVTNGSSYGVTHYIGLSNATSHSTAQTSMQSSSAWTSYVINSLYGQRVVALPLNSTLTPGRYWLALANSTTTSNLNNLNFSVSMMAVSTGPGPDIRPFGTSSAASNASVYRAIQGWGTYSATSNAFPDTIALSTDHIRAAVSQTIVQFNVSGIGTATNML